MTKIKIENNLDNKNVILLKIKQKCNIMLMKVQKFLVFLVNTKVLSNYYAHILLYFLDT